MAAVGEALALIERGEAALVEAGALFAQARARLGGVLGQQPALPHMDARTAARVEKLGPVAHQHLLFVETHGSMTRADSLAIRRQMYGDNVRATANLFGTKGSHALFYRACDYADPVRDDDRILLTDEGERIAKLWRAVHGL